MIKILWKLNNLIWRLIYLKFQTLFIKRKVNKMGPVLDKVQELANALDVATTEVANDLQALKDQLAQAGTPQEVEAILQPIVDKLTALGNAQ